MGRKKKKKKKKWKERKEKNPNGKMQLGLSTRSYANSLVSWGRKY